MNQTPLPEEIPSVGKSARKAPNGAARIGAKAGDTRDKIVEEAQKLKEKAGARATEYAGIGKDKTSDALDGLSKLIRDAAGSVDERLGESYGQYARKAADLISSAASSLREKELAAVADDTRALIRKSPVAAVGVAAAIGFMLARLMKSGGSNNDANA